MILYILCLEATSIGLSRVTKMSSGQKFEPRLSFRFPFRVEKRKAFFHVDRVASIPVLLACKGNFSGGWVSELLSAVSLFYFRDTIIDIKETEIKLVTFNNIKVVLPDHSV